MRKAILNLAPAALAILALTGTSHAATNAQVIVTADVVAASCDVSLSTNNLDLGNFTPKAFTTIATPIAASIKPFTVGLNNCDAPCRPVIPPIWWLVVRRWVATQIYSILPVPIPALC